MTEWISVKDRLPLQAIESVQFETVYVIASDGVEVRECAFNRGHGCGAPWAKWGNYNEINSGSIIEWQPLPSPTGAKT